MKYSLKTETGYFNRNGFNKEEFILTASQTNITISYKIGYIEVIKEGIYLMPYDYEATSGTSITLLEEAEEGERLVVKRLKYLWS